MAESLLKEVWKLRQATFLGFGLRVSEKAPKIFKETGLSDHLMMFSALSPQLRRQITEYPPFRIWLKQSTRIFALSLEEINLDNDQLKDKLAEIERVIISFYKNEANPYSRIQKTRTQVSRFAVDPLIIESISPSYVFPDETRQHELEQKSVYHLSFFLEVVTTALQRIKNAWPAAYQDFSKFVRLIIHVPDGEFRSCSADRYAGVILLSANDGSLLEVEESLLHEFGHQILYNVMELDPLFITKTGKQYKLPWSGQERDFYGYFHAFYIYILLASYYERIAGHPKKEQKQADDRISHILRGLIEALPDFDSATEFTLLGEGLFHLLREEVHQLVERNRSLL